MFLSNRLSMRRRAFPNRPARNAGQTPSSTPHTDLEQRLARRFLDVLPRSGTPPPAGDLRAHFRRDPPPLRGQLM